MIEPEDLADYALSQVEIGPHFPASVTIDGTPIQKRYLFKKLVDKSLLKGVEDGVEVLLLEDDALTKYTQRFNNYFHKTAKEMQQQKWVAEAAIKSYGDGLKFTDLIPLVDVRTGVKGLLNPVTDSLSTVHYDVWVESLAKEERNARLGARINADLIYDPYNLEKCRLEPFEGIGKVLKINTYVPPEWRQEPMPEEEIAELECPELVWRLLVHLFPDDEAREFVLQWMRNCILTRNESYLVLNAAKGIGKGIFASVFEAIVGKEHFTEAHRGFLDSQFNSILKNRRMVVLDELSVDTPAKCNHLKRYANKYQNIEEKGKDADQTIETFTNFMITNNSTADMHVEADDRRFSIMEVTNERLENCMTPKEIGELQRLLKEDIEYQRQLGYWLLHYGESETYRVNDVWKGPAFERLCYLSLPEWGRYVVDTLLANPGMEFTYKDIRQGYRKDTGATDVKIGGKQKVEDLLKNYRKEGETVGISYVNRDGAWVIKRETDDDESEEIEDEDVLFGF